MADLDLTTTANVPSGTSITITVYEDEDGDGSAENQASQAIDDGTNTYTLSGFSGSGSYWIEAEFDHQEVTKTAELDRVVLGGAGGQTIDLTGLVQDKQSLIDDIQATADEVFELGAEALANFTGPVIPESELKRLLDGDRLIDQRAQEFLDGIPPSSDRTPEESRQYQEALERLIAAEEITNQAVTFPVSNVPPLVPFTPEDNRSIIRQEVAAAMAALWTVILEAVTLGSGKLAKRVGGSRLETITEASITIIFGIAEDLYEAIPAVVDGVGTTYKAATEGPEGVIGLAQKNVREEVTSTILESDERVDRLFETLSADDPMEIASDGVVDPDRKLGFFQQFTVGIEDLFVTLEFGRLTLAPGIPGAIEDFSDFDPASIEIDLPDEHIPDSIPVPRPDEIEEATNTFGGWVEDASSHVDQIDYDHEPQDIPAEIDMSGWDLPDSMTVDHDQLPDLAAFQEAVQLLDDVDDFSEGVDVAMDELVAELEGILGDLDEQDDEVREQLNSAIQQVNKDGTVLSYALFDVLNGVVSGIDDIEFIYDVISLAATVIASVVSLGTLGILAKFYVELFGTIFTVISLAVDGIVNKAGRTYLDAVRAGHNGSGKLLVSSNLDNFAR